SPSETVTAMVAFPVTAFGEDMVTTRVAPVPEMLMAESGRIFGSLEAADTNSDEASASESLTVTAMLAGFWLKRIGARDRLLRATTGFELAVAPPLIVPPMLRWTRP